MFSPNRRFAVASAAALVSFSSLGFAQSVYEADPTYYSAVNLQSATSLKDQLASIMTAGHVQSTYSQAADYMPFTDANPANLTQMFLVYHPRSSPLQKPSASHVRFTGAYESREHIWPDSLQGGNTQNSTTDSRGDIHMLKPLDQSTNSSRSNNYFWGYTNTSRTTLASGAGRNVVSGLWYPGDADRGDVARIAFYGATRWASRGLNLIDGTSGGGFTMGDKASLLRFHYADTPDTFELRRNDVIYRGDDTQTANDDMASWGGTRNRNAYIDRPEYVWSAFVDQQNDTRLRVGTADANGGSTAPVVLGRVLRNGAVPAAQNVTLTKEGVDGVYYAVTAANGATSSVTGRYNAFAMDATGSRQISVGLNTSTATAGLKQGSVTIDNLDVTTQGGTGRGGNDANDVINVSLKVLDVSNSSFLATEDKNTLNLDFGAITQGTAANPLAFSLHNLASSFGTDLTARLDLDQITASGNASTLTTDLLSFTNLDAGSARAYLAYLNTSVIGDFNATYLLNLSDENLPGTVSTSTLTLQLSGSVVAVPEPATMGLLLTGLLALGRRARRR